MQKLLQRSAISARVLMALMALVLAFGLVPVTHASAAYAATTPFTASVGDTAVAESNVALTKDGYTYTEYGATEASHADLYTVTVPAGTVEATLDFGITKNLVYSYDKSGKNVAACGTFDYLVGETSAPITLADSAGDALFMRVQNPYNADYTGGELLYVVTFKVESALDPDPDPEPTPTSDPDTPASSAGSYTADKASTLISNLTARFAKGGANAGIANMTVPAAFALHAEGLGSSLDGEAIAAALANSEATDTYFSVGTLAKYVLALNAAGVDCTAVNVNGTTRNLVNELVEGIDDGSAINSWSAVYLLPALDAVAPTQTDLIAKMVNVITANQASEGFFGADYGSDYADSQVTAQAIMALAGHGQDAAVAKAKSALLSRQLSDGGFAYMAGDTTSNLEATCAVVYALSSLGVDSATVKSATGFTPLDYIVAKADSNLAGYSDNTSANEPMTSAEALLALVSYQGQTLTGKAFNAYVDVCPTVTPESDTTSSSNAKGTAQTGDANEIALGLLALMAIGSACAVAAARRRMQD